MGEFHHWICDKYSNKCRLQSLFPFPGDAYKPGLIAIADGRIVKEKQFSDAAREEQTAAGGALTAFRRRRWSLSSSAAADAELHPRL